MSSRLFTLHTQDIHVMSRFATKRWLPKLLNASNKFQGRFFQSYSVGFAYHVPGRSDISTSPDQFINTFRLQWKSRELLSCFLGYSVSIRY